MSQSISHARYPGARTAPSKWKVRKLIPIRSWHSVGAVGSELYSVFINGNMSSSIFRPASACAIRGSVCWVAASGGGVGAWDSHIRSDRNWGSAATSWLSAVVPVRGNPITKTGPPTTWSSISGMLSVGVLDLEALNQGVADGGVLDDPAHVVERLPRCSAPQRCVRVPRGSRTNRSRRDRLRRKRRLLVRQHRTSPPEPFAHGAAACREDGCPLFGGDLCGVRRQFRPNIVEGHDSASWV